MCIGVVIGIIKGKKRKSSNLESNVYSTSTSKEKEKNSIQGLNSEKKLHDMK